MADICDRSPCDSLLRSIGHFITGSPDKPQFVLHIELDGDMQQIPITYCPYCGTRLDPAWCSTEWAQPRKRRQAHQVIANKRARRAVSGT